MSIAIVNVHLTAFMLQFFYLASMCHIISDDVNMLKYQRDSIEHIDSNNLTLITQTKELSSLNITQIILSIIEEHNYEAIVHLINNLKEFFEFPFKYLIKFFGFGGGNANKPTPKFDSENYILLRKYI